MSDYKKDYLGYNFIWFMGVVEDRLDPLKLGRVRVRCFSWHSNDKEKTPTATLPWSQCVFDSTNANLSGFGRSPTGILEGSWVFGFFLDGEDAQKPLILGTLPGIPQNLPDTDFGFNDPNGRYPNIINEPDTSRLARGENVTETIVQSKKSNRETEVSVANTLTTWSEPQVPYNASYPFNHTWTTEGGHVIEVDDTPGNERIHIYHKSGSFVEIDSIGTKVTKTVGDTYEIQERNGNLLVKGEMNITVEGDANFYMKNNANIDVDGNLNVKVKNDFNLDVSGKTNISVKEDFGLLAESIKLESSEGTFDIYADGADLNIYSTNIIKQKSARWYMDADLVHMNSDKTNGTTFGQTEFETPVNRSVVTPINLPPLENINIEDTFFVETDDAIPQGDTISDEDFAGAILQYGITSSTGSLASLESVLSGIPIPGNITIPEPDLTPAPNISPSNTQKDESIANKTDFPESYKLSENFTVGDLTTRVLINTGKHKLRPQLGLSKAQIVQNLKLVAENCLEPILAKYPDIKINSAFRTESGKSQHNKGQAVDISFPGLRKVDLYDIALDLKSFVPFDQMILEYSKPGWVHVSFSSERQRGETLTCVVTQDPKKYHAGLRNFFPKTA
jgi:uncharacterized protein YxjI